MNAEIIEERSISKLPYFDGTNCTEWKERIKIFIQSVDFNLWLVIENGPKIPKKIIDGEELVKTEDEFNDEDMKIMELDEQAKNILCCALNPDDLRRISNCKTAKEMWEELDNEVTITNVPSKQKTTNVNFTPLLSHQTWPSARFMTPNLEILEEKGDDRFLNHCVPIYKHALKGNWPAAKRILDAESKLINAALTNEWSTLLHIAAGANRIEFVKELLKLLDDNDIALQDINGNTAFCIAAAAGNMKIVDLMLDRKPQLPVIRGGNGYTPIQHAALQGRCKMTRHLYDKTIRCFEDNDWALLFFACIETGIYDLALKMVEERNRLAFARNENGETALHLLAHNPIVTNPETKFRIAGTKNHVVYELVKFLWSMNPSQILLLNKYLSTLLLEANGTYI